MQIRFLLRRIGLLGPEPAHPAVRATASHQEIGVLARDHGDDGMMRRTMTGVYRELGREIA
jgi:hypothetical protein